MLRPVSGTVHPRLWLLPSLPSSNFPSQAGEKRKEEMIAEEGGKGHYFGRPRIVLR
jgi:hypothetical protein